MKTITINNNVFVEKTIEGVLQFNKNKHYGFYLIKRGKGTAIILMDAETKIFAAVVSNSSGFKGIVNASEHSPSQIFFQFAASENVEKLLGVPRYLEQEAHVDSIIAQVE